VLHFRSCLYFPQAVSGFDEGEKQSKLDWRNSLDVHSRSKQDDESDKAGRPAYLCLRIRLYEQRFKTLHRDDGRRVILQVGAGELLLMMLKGQK
jgi:hypothetical protein